MKPEILAPAGSMEALIAGVRTGADAVYLGGKLFSARRSAGNFSEEELEQAVRFCHARGVKVHLAVNTAVKDSEMAAAAAFVAQALRTGVDALIIADPGLIEVVRRTCPQAVLHASTQMNVCTAAGAKKLEDAGFARMVLPREMNKTEIAALRRQTALELEAFVHGALCMCLSGQCRLSAMIGSRSGNRGACAQPCRLPFSAKSDKSERALSLKDLSLVEKIEELSALGINSLKIEGRMKRPEYVAAATTACKNARAGRSTPDERQALAAVFSRSGFTDGYFTGRTDKSLFGFRRKEDVTAATAPLLKGLEKLYEKETPRTGVQMDFTCKAGEACRLRIQAGGQTAEVTGAVPEPAEHRALSAQEVRERLARLGGTPFYTESINCTVGDGLSLRAAELNALRRDAVQALENALCARPVPKTLPFAPAAPDSRARKTVLTARFRTAEQIPENHPFARIWLPVWETEGNFAKHGAQVYIPAGLFGVEEKIAAKLQKLKAHGVREALCANLDAAALAEEAGLTVFADHSMNVFNSYAPYKNVTAPFELTAAEIRALHVPGQKTVIVYGRLVLMTFRACPVQASTGCTACQKHGVLTDRTGRRFPVLCSPLPCKELLNSDVLDMAGKIEAFGADCAELYFTTETKEDVQRVTNAFLNGRPAAGKNATHGLYYRGVL